MLSTRVVIIGAGPVGLLAAICLDEAGIPNLLVERRLERHEAPKAHAVNPRTLEICQRAGVSADAIRAAGASVADGGLVHFVDVLNGTRFGHLPYERQTDDAKAFTPWPLVNIAQPRFEQFLSQRLTRCERTALLRGFTAESFRETDDGVVATLRSVGVADEIEVHADYVIAADGAGSRTRDRLGIEMVGPAALQNYLMIHFEADLSDVTHDAPGLLYFCTSPQASGVFIGYERDRNWVFMHSFDPESERREDFTPERCRAIVEAAVGETLDAFSVKNLSPWAMSAQVATTYRAGRVFLAGDAAHRFPPTGGLGLNTGIADAQNLTWKLAKVIQGEASNRLLDSYDAERRPVALINSQQSLTNSAKLLHLFAALYGPDPAQKDEHFAAVCADPNAHPAVAAGVEAQRPHFDSFNLQLGYRYGAELDPSEIDISEYVPGFEVGDYLPHIPLADDTWLLGHLNPSEFSLVTGPKAAAWRTCNTTTLCEDTDFAVRDETFIERARLGRDGALLVRPDGHIAARWRVAPVDAAVQVRREINQALGY